MRAAFIAVGSELLGTERTDTNSLRITRVLERFGVELRRKSVIGDIPSELVFELRSVLGRVDLLVISGGLGPTTDDRTREAFAEACGLTMELREDLVDKIRRRFDSFSRKMPEVNRRQAMVLDGATVLANPLGTAPGLRLEHLGTTCFLFPGVPRELDGLSLDFLEPWLLEHAGEAQLEASVLKVACRGESDIEELLEPAYEEFGAEAITVLSSPGEIRIELWCRGEVGERRAKLRVMSQRVQGLLGHAIFAQESETTLEGVCGDLLRELRQTVATAESCTGGLIAERLTSVPGSSSYFVGSVVAYADRAKEKLVQVPPSLIEAKGAVSRAVALALARGSRDELGTDFGIGVTGVAGPGGGTEDKPVGTIHLAVAGPLGSGDLIHRQVKFAGDRGKIRRMTSQLALEMLRRRLLGLDRGPGVRERGAEH